MAQTQPAIVQGSERAGVAIFIEDARGDLVDIEYLCGDCALDTPEATGALIWPAFDFGQSGAYCRQCHEMIEKPGDN